MEVCYRFIEGAEGVSFDTEIIQWKVFKISWTFTVIITYSTVWV